MLKNLLELCLSPDLGGLELYMVRSAKAFDDAFNVVSVINTESKLEQYFKQTSYTYFQIPRKRSFSLIAAQRLSKIIDEKNIDVIHMHWTKDLPIAVMAKLMSKKKPKLVQTRHMTMTRFKNDFYHRFLYRHMDLILPVSHQVAEQIQKFIPESIRPALEVIYMGSDKPELLKEKEIQAYQEEMGVKGDTFVIGMVGRVEEVKRQYLLIEAAQKLKAQGIDTKVFFVGHAMQESYLEKLKSDVKARGLQDEVSFLGFMKHPHHFMQACQVVVLATPCETFGLVLIEAMRAGTAVVATNNCGPLEIIDDGRTGLLFEKDSSSDLASKLKMLADDRAFCTKVALAGQEAAEEKFSNERQFKRVGTVLKSI